MYACKLNTESVAHYLLISVTEYRVVVHSVHSLTTNWYESIIKFTFTYLLLACIMENKYKSILHSQTYHWTKFEGNLEFHDVWMNKILMKIQYYNFHTTLTLPVLYTTYCCCDGILVCTVYFAIYNWLSYVYAVHIFWNIMMLPKDGCR
jgi:hypothetical protein